VIIGAGIVPALSYEKGNEHGIHMVFVYPQM
jgi:hypothetical protein